MKLNNANSPPLEKWLRHVGSVRVLEALAELGDTAAVFAVDAERRIIFWSHGAERLLGFQREEVLGQHCLKANRCQQCMRGCGIAQHGSVTGAALSLYRQDGETMPIRKYAQAFFDEQGVFNGGIEMLVPAIPIAAPPPSLPFTALRENAVNFHGLLSRSPQMQQVVQIVRNVAETEATVLVRGASGSGKELIARALHTLSHRHAGPFLAINCAALSPSLLESELFGHVKGAFTGAIKDHAGLFQQANGGTVFLDEIAELPIDLQAKLLRVLQERSFIPVGGNRAITVDIRIVAATHRSLREEVQAGRFREDLMYRLRVVPIFLPSLRERREDIGLLLWHFIEQHNRQGPRRIERIAPDAMKKLLDYHWPGNVRELKNVVEYASAVGRGPELQLSELPPEFRDPPASAPTPGFLPPSIGKKAEPLTPEQEREKIRQALQQTGGEIHAAARLIGMSRATFWRKRRLYNI